ncbi:MAG: glutamine synthetase family protein [Pseudomonadota bacterium]
MNSSDDVLSKLQTARYVDFFYNDLSCVIRGKRYPAGQAEKVLQNGMMIPGGSFLLAVNGECMDPEGMGFSDGDPDEVGAVIPHTVTPTTWSRYPTAHGMITLNSLDGVPYYYEPRNVLSRVLNRFIDTGLTPVVAFELEFYLLDIKRQSDGGIRAPSSPLTGQITEATQVYNLDDLEDFSEFFDDIMTACEAQGIQTGAISSEYAPGQFEINLQHSSDILRAADHCVMFKRTVQGVARKHGMQATFMAKPYPEHSGSGLHLHISMLDEDGGNAFDGGGEYSTPECGSELLYQAIGGVLHSMDEFMGVLAPSVNSYKRFVPNIYVPVSKSWAYENRSVALRIPKSPGKARRIEHRIAGADANPYLTAAAILAGIHNGIANRMDCPPPAIGNAGEQLDPQLPFDAALAFDRSRAGRTVNSYFGENYVRAYTSCKQLELDAFHNSKAADSDWYV